MKTTLDHFNEIPCPIVRRRAIRNCDEPEKQESSLKWAIHGGFVWRETPEGVAYWSEVYENPLAPSPEHLLPDGYREEEGNSPNGIILFENVQQRLIELIADYLNSEDLKIDEAAAQYKDPLPIEETELHIRMGKAAFAEYKRTVVSTATPPTT